MLDDVVAGIELFRTDASVVLVFLHPMAVLFSPVVDATSLLRVTLLGEYFAVEGTRPCYCGVLRRHLCLLK